MWRTSLCVRTCDPGTHNQLIYKNKKSILLACLRVEAKEPTEDEKHSGSDHPQRFTHINTAPFGARGGGYV